MKTLPIILSALLLVSCEKALMPSPPDSTPTALFDELWQQFDRQYSLFDVKEVDWQQVYNTYRPAIDDHISTDSLFNCCAAMLNTLNDGHVNLYSGYDISHSDSITYRSYHDSQYDINTIILGYLGTNYHTTGGIAHQSIAGGKVIYMRYGSFSNNVSNSQLLHILKSYPDAQGLIIDIRGNGGGSTQNIHSLLSIFPSRGQLLYYSQIKSGPAHDQFSSPYATYAQPSPDSDLFDGPTIVLVDRGCYSASSMFALCCLSYPNITLLGDTTGGGLGLPAMGYLANGWRYRLPVTRILAPDGTNYENGVPPQHVVTFDRQSALNNLKDNLIDSACTLITNH